MSLSRSCDIALDQGKYPMKMNKLKKRLSLLAVSAGMLLSARAHAQSSVTLYGILDSGIAYVYNAQSSNGQNQIAVTIDACCIAEV
jgi:hypothetical protein